MADTIVKVQLDPGSIEQIKLALAKEISVAVELAYKQGYSDRYPFAVNLDELQASWEASEVKKKLDSLRNSS